MIDSNLEPKKRKRAKRVKPPISKKYYSVKRNWASSAKQKTTKVERTIHYLLVAAGVFFVGSLITAFFVFYFDLGNTISTNKIDIKIKGSTIVSAGVPASFEIIIKNRNPVELDDTSLILNFPEGVYNLNSETPTRTARVDIGTIAVGAEKKKEISYVFYGEKDKTIPIMIDFEYRPKGSTTPFTFERDFFVKIGNSIATINVDSLNVVESGRLFDIEVVISGNANNVSDITFSPDFPNSFVVQDIRDRTGSLGVDILNFEIPSLSQGKSKTYTISGIVIGSNEDNQVFNFNVEKDRAIIARSNYQIKVTKPFINTEIYINGKKGTNFVVEDGEGVDLELIWENQSSSTIYDLSIEIGLNGNGIKLASLKARNSEFNEFTNSAVWDKTTNSRFEEIRVGSSGVIDVSFDSIASNPLFTDTNRVINVDVNVSGKRISSDKVLDRISLPGIANIKLAGKIFYSSKTLFATGNIGNTGPVPPEVGKETTYTLRYTIQNNANKLTNAKLKIYLEKGVVFDNIFFPSGESITYDSEKNTVLWELGDIEPKSKNTRTLDIKVSITPELTDIGNEIVLSEKYEFIARDEFIGRDVVAEKTDINTTAFDTEPIYLEFYGSVSE